MPMDIRRKGGAGMAPRNPYLPGGGTSGGQLPNIPFGGMPGGGGMVGGPSGGAKTPWRPGGGGGPLMPPPSGGGGEPFNFMRENFPGWEPNPIIDWSKVIIGANPIGGGFGGAPTGPMRGPGVGGGPFLNPINPGMGGQFGTGNPFLNPVYPNQPGAGMGQTNPWIEILRRRLMGGGGMTPFPQQM